MSSIRRWVEPPNAKKIENTENPFITKTIFLYCHRRQSTGSKTYLYRNKIFLYDDSGEGVYGLINISAWYIVWLLKVGKIVLVYLLDPKVFKNQKYYVILYIIY